ncbi:MAG: hypothetical protein PHF70_11520 [Opitutales bacterium]|nr:hypothetical protein [Opitutales bacterium]
MKEILIPIEELNERILLIEYFNERILSVLEKKQHGTGMEGKIRALSTQITESMDELCSWAPSENMEARFRMAS